MSFEGEKTREKGPSAEELNKDVKERAAKLLGAYEKNTAGIMENKGLQHGAPDPEGHMHHAQQMQRILKTIGDPRVEAHHWPENFELPTDIPIVFKTKEGEVVERRLNIRDFDNPKKMVDSIEEILTVAQIDGL